MSKDTQRAWYLANRERLLAKARERDLANKEERRARYHADIEKSRAKRRAHYAANKEKYVVWAKRYRAKNRARVVAVNAARRAAVDQRTPSWADRDAIRAFYAAAPPGDHVDHIIPLRGKTVSGLHVLSNLQYLTASANTQKANSYAV